MATSSFAYWYGRQLFFSLILPRSSCHCTLILLITQRVKVKKERIWQGQQKLPQCSIKSGYLESYGLNHNFKILPPALFGPLNLKYILNTLYFTFPEDRIPFSICEVGLHRQTSQVLLKKINICLFIRPEPYCKFHGFTNYS